MKREITKTEETGHKPEIFVLRPYILNIANWLKKL